MRLLVIAGTIAVLAAPLQAQAVGCVTGGIAGGVAGHYAGHHAVVGAVGGCIAGHELHKKQHAARLQNQETTAPPAAATAPAQ